MKNILGYDIGELRAIVAGQSLPGYRADQILQWVYQHGAGQWEQMTNLPGELRDRLAENTRFFRAEIVRRGFEILPGEHPIVPIMLGEATLAQKMAARLLEKGVYVIGFFFPVVPRGEARIRVQISAAHTREDLDFALAAFKETKEEFGV